MPNEEMFVSDKEVKNMNSALLTRQLVRRGIQAGSLYFMRYSLLALRPAILRNFFRGLRQSMQMLGNYLKIGHDYFHILFRFNIHSLMILSFDVA